MRWGEKDKLDLLSKEKQGKKVTRKNLIFSSYQSNKSKFWRVLFLIYNFIFWTSLKMFTLLKRLNSENGCRTDGRTETIDFGVQSFWEAVVIRKKVSNYVLSRKWVWDESRLSVLQCFWAQKRPDRSSARFGFKSLLPKVAVWIRPLLKIDELTEIVD